MRQSCFLEVELSDHKSRMILKAEPHNPLKFPPSPNGSTSAENSKQSIRNSNSEGRDDATFPFNDCSVCPLVLTSGKLVIIRAAKRGNYLVA